MIKGVDSIRYFLYNVDTTKELKNLIKPANAGLAPQSFSRGKPHPGKVKHHLIISEKENKNDRSKRK